MKKIMVIIMALLMPILATSSVSAAPEMSVTAIQKSLQNGTTEAALLQQLTANGMSIIDAVSAMVTAVPARAAAIKTAAIAIAPDQAASISTAVSLAQAASDPTTGLLASGAGGSGGRAITFGGGLGAGGSGGGGGPVSP